MAPHVPSLRHPLVARLVRYGSVSAISTVTSLTLLAVLVGVVGLGAIWSNVVATAVGTVPSFELNRRWVWSRGGGEVHPRQVVPYVVLSFTGLAVSTFAVHLASDATLGASRPVHTSIVELANLAAYGALWLVQFVLCDRILFKRPTVESLRHRPARMMGARRPPSLRWFPAGHDRPSNRGTRSDRAGAATGAPTPGIRPPPSSPRGSCRNPSPSSKRRWPTSTAHALGFARLAAYGFADWSEAPEPWAQQIHVLDASIHRSDDREAFAACIARAWTGGFAWVPAQVRGECPMWLASWSAPRPKPR